jgi:hypothetical protein
VIVFWETALPEFDGSDTTSRNPTKPPYGLA